MSDEHKPLRQMIWERFISKSVDWLVVAAIGGLVIVIFRTGVGIPNHVASSLSNKIRHCLELCPKVGDGVIRRRFEVA
jgi:hypothetical protein